MANDIDKLRKTLIDDDLGAFFGGGFGGALVESFDIEKASTEELLNIARRKGIDPGFDIDKFDD